MQVRDIEIADRFRGPPRSGNGGYVCGIIAASLSGAVAVRLRAPPPLRSPLKLESTDAEAKLIDGATVIGTAKRSPLTLDVPPCPTRADAEQAVQFYDGFNRHAFPGCFVCGPAREPGDGLRIFPGVVGSGPVIAAPWTPDVSLADPSGRIGNEFLWAALDCPGAFAMLPWPEDRALVLGELWAEVIGSAQAGDPCVVIAWPLGLDGRKRLAGSAVYSARGRLLAKARAVWVEVPLATWN